MSNNFIRRVSAYVFACALPACAGTALEDQNDDRPRTRALAKGDRGEDVRALHDYLRRYGYLPNAELADRFADWRPPIAEDSADPSTFDDTLEDALLLYQRAHG